MKDFVLVSSATRRLGVARLKTSGLVPLALLLVVLTATMGVAQTPCVTCDEQAPLDCGGMPPTVPIPSPIGNPVVCGTASLLCEAHLPIPVPNLGLPAGLNGISPVVTGPPCSIPSPPRNEPCSFTGSWVGTEACPDWQGTFEMLSDPRQQTGQSNAHPLAGDFGGTALLDFSGLPLGVLPAGSLLLLSDFDRGTGRDEFVTLVAYGPGSTQITAPWLGRPCAAYSGPAPFPPTTNALDMPGWSFDENTGAYQFDGRPVTNNPAVGITIRTTVDLVRLELCNNTFGANVYLQAPRCCEQAAPECSAGADFSLQCGQVSLSGATAEDPEMDPLTYDWTSSCPDAVFVPDSTTLNPTVDLSSSCARSCIFTLTVDDGNGGICTDSVLVEVDDDTAPVVDPLPLIEVQCGEDIPPPDIAIVSFTDNCAEPSTVEFVGDVSDSEHCPETVTRLYRVIDGCGNSTDVTQTITVNDDIAPTVSISLAPAEPMPASSSSSACPSSAAVRIVCEGLADNCEPSPTLELTLLLVGYDTSSGQCIEEVTEVAVSCDDIIETHLLPPACPVSPTSAGTAVSVNSAGVTVVSAHSISLVATATDGCGNQATVSVAADCPLVGSSGDCEVTPCGVPAPPPGVTRGTLTRRR